MEDVIQDSESLLLPSNLSPRGGGGGGAKGEEGHHANGFNNEGKEVDKEQTNGNEGKDEEKGGGGGGGIITHLISIVSPRSTPKEGEAAKRKVDFEVDDIGNGGFSSKSEQVGFGGGGGENSNGGVFSSLISNFFNQSDGGGGGGGEENEVENEAEKVTKDIGNKKLKVEDEKEGGEGGIIDNIVSHLPTSLPDDAAPSTDEASILITSIVRD